MRWLPSATVLVFAANNLWLKAAYPGWVTGKLSDLLACFFLPLFIAKLMVTARMGSSDRTRLLVGSLVTAGVLVGINLFPAIARAHDAALTVLLIPIDLSTHTTPDPTDLIALVAIRASWSYAARFGLGDHFSSVTSAALGPGRRILRWAPLAFTTLALIGHSPTGGGGGGSFDCDEVPRSEVSFEIDPLDCTYVAADAITVLRPGHGDKSLQIDEGSHPYWLEGGFITCTSAGLEEGGWWLESETHHCRVQSPRDDGEGTMEVSCMLIEFGGGDSCTFALTPL